MGFRILLRLRVVIARVFVGRTWGRHIRSTCIELLGLLSTPFLWGAYYSFIPIIRRPTVRLTVVFMVLMLHLVPGIWLASTEPAFHGALRLLPVFVAVYFAGAVAVFVGLVALSLYSGARHDRTV